MDIKLEDLTARGRAVADRVLKLADLGLRFLQAIVHPIQSLTLLAAGSKREYLSRAPSDMVWHSVLGTLVLLASVLAGFGAFASAGFVQHGEITVATPEIAWGVGWGAVIFVLDRAIVRMPLLPVAMNHRVLSMLWNPSADVQWYVKAAEGKPISMTLSNWRGAGHLLFGAIPRVGIAVAASFVFSETLLFVYFQHDLRPVMIHMVQESRDILSLQAQETFENDKNSLTKQLGDLELSLDKMTPSIAAQREKMSALDAKRRNAEIDASVYKELWSKERAGVLVTLTLSDGTQRTTSGDPNVSPNVDGIQSGSYGAEAARLRQEALNLQNQFNDLERDVNQRVKKIQQEPEYQAVLAKLNALKPADIAAIDPEHIKGIGIRRVALDTYAHDANPITPQGDPPLETCRGDWVCGAWQTLVPNTPAGPIVGAVRAIFFFVELSPLLAKIAYTLRRRRPYDEAVAADEIMTAAEILVDLSAGLNLYGQTIEEHARQRRARRGSEAAEYVVARHQFRSDREYRVPSAAWRQWWRQDRRKQKQRQQVRLPPRPPAQPNTNE